MIRKLFKIALISTPIIGIYGSSPIFIFVKINSLEFFFLNLAICISVFLTWVTLIFTIYKFPTWNIYLRFTITYIGNVALRFIVMPIAHLFGATEPPNLIEQYMLYPIITSLGINAIVMIIANSIVSSHKNLIMEKEVQNLKYQNTEAQKQVLIQQLQPHFLFNTLSVLKSLISESPKLAIDYTIRLSNFLRYSIQAKDNPLITLGEELSFTNDYIELQKVRFGESFIVHMDIKNDSLQNRVPIYALQSLVENAIKHNSFNEKNPLIINIVVFKNKLCIENNLSPKQNKSFSGTGLKNLSTRYELLSKNAIEIVETKEKFSVTIDLI